MHSMLLMGNLSLFVTTARIDHHIQKYNTQFARRGRIPQLRKKHYHICARIDKESIVCSVGSAYFRYRFHNDTQSMPLVVNKASKLNCMKAKKKKKTKKTRI